MDKYLELRNKYDTFIYEGYNVEEKDNKTIYYNTKLKQIDTNIKSIVVTKAKEMKYNLVLPKSIVLFGGDDITDEVAKSVK